jgi:hypothetical protein
VPRSAARYDRSTAKTLELRTDHRVASGNQTCCCASPDRYHTRRVSQRDRYLPGEETPAGQQIKLAGGIADWLRSPRRLAGFGGPMLITLGVFIVIVVALVLTSAL